MNISNKQYQCPVCGNMETHQTNHFMEIYCHCTKCDNGTLYCVELEGVALLNAREKTTAVIRFYRYDTSFGNEKSRYTEFKRWRSAVSVGTQLFSVLTAFKTMEALKKHNNETVIVYDQKLFTGQYITSIGRLHDWYEAVYQNTKIKEGYYLEFTTTTRG